MKTLIAVLCMFAFGAGAAQAQMHDDHRGPAVAKCRDGSVSYRHEMTCRGHHGVKFYYHHR